MHNESPRAKRRHLLKALAASGALLGLQSLLPAYAGIRGTLSTPRSRKPTPVTMDLRIERNTLDIAGGVGHGLTVNDSIPGPVIELYEGQDALLRVHNGLDVSSSIHWHGILLPFELDGVPGVVFPGIAPGATFEARFPVRQYGTYWYHSHSGLQEQIGTYGPIVIHPREPEPYGYERDYVVMLSDWTFEDPHDVMTQLRKKSDYYNFQQRTAGDLFRDIRRRGFRATLEERLAWQRMRMSPTDIADVTGQTYTYLMNGMHVAENWTGLFDTDERVRLRFINGSAMTYFNVRLPGLPMTVVQADGQDVEPAETDEFQIGVAETIDVIVSPASASAYTIMAESMDRSGYVRGTLAPRAGMSAAVPPLRSRPLRRMVDMGMAMPGMQHAVPDTAGTPNGAGAGHAQHGSETSSGNGMNMHDVRGHAGAPSGPVIARHGPDRHGAGNVGVAENLRNRLAERGTGLEDENHRVLTYADLRNTVPMRDTRAPSATIELHLTGNMERYMWSFDGQQFHEVKETVRFPLGERIRLVLVNDTMMEHPIHLHGMFMELENGQGDRLPFKHTVSVKPAERMSLLITADEPGRWAFHCHFLYHMDMGMFRVVEVS